MEIIEARMPPTGPICDFCSDPHPVATHVCMPHVVDVHQEIGPGVDKATVVSDADGLWAACAECDEMIRKEQWGALLERSCESLKKQLGYLPSDARRFIQRQHNLFRANRGRKAS